jgi:hypothetical protein
MFDQSYVPQVPSLAIVRDSFHELLLPRVNLAKLLTTPDSLVLMPRSLVCC